MRLLLEPDDREVCRPRPRGNAAACTQASHHVDALTAVHRDPCRTAWAALAAATDDADDCAVAWQRGATGRLL
jgi:hypothetical protein